MQAWQYQHASAEETNLSAPKNQKPTPTDGETNREVHTKASRRLVLWGSAAVAIALQSSGVSSFIVPKTLAITRVGEIRAKMLEYGVTITERDQLRLEQAQWSNYYPWNNMWQNWPNFPGWAPRLKRIWRWPRC